jgi:hypothetical protein
MFAKASAQSLTDPILRTCNKNDIISKSSMMELYCLSPGTGI